MHSYIMYSSLEIFPWIEERQNIFGMLFFKSTLYSHCFSFQQDSVFSGNFFLLLQVYSKNLMIDLVWAKGNETWLFQGVFVITIVTYEMHQINDISKFFSNMANFLVYFIEYSCLFSVTGRNETSYFFKQATTCFSKKFSENRVFNGIQWSNFN